ncbi:uncharacterized protein LOC117176612 [Belonocnema kinseyi]|uniref:uncharacterized protein LOC117176612 n=1 Tax=Belonocnema kinseyi TaxID=2817044 RepID=UPI00143CDA63|nr:uncharacterized protein LOC117176612 [Belonocnema kinseyi]
MKRIERTYSKETEELRFQRILVSTEFLGPLSFMCGFALRVLLCKTLCSFSFWFYFIKRITAGFNQERVLQNCTRSLRTPGDVSAVTTSADRQIGDYGLRWLQYDDPVKFSFTTRTRSERRTTAFCIFPASISIFC